MTLCDLNCPLRSYFHTRICVFIMLEFLKDLFKTVYAFFLGCRRTYIQNNLNLKLLNAEKI